MIHTDGIPTIACATPLFEVVATITVREDGVITAVDHREPEETIVKLVSKLL